MRTPNRHPAAGALLFAGGGVGMADVLKRAKAALWGGGGADHELLAELITEIERLRRVEADANRRLCDDPSV